MSGEFDSKKVLQSAKLGRGPRIFVKLSFREMCDSKLCGLHAFDNMDHNSLSLDWFYDFMRHQFLKLFF